MSRLQITIYNVHTFSIRQVEGGGIGSLLLMRVHCNNMYTYIPIQSAMTDGLYLFCKKANAVNITNSRWPAV